MDTPTLKLQGMNCTASASNIEQVIRSVPSVTNCHINFAAEQATIKYDRLQTTLENIQAVFPRRCW